MQEALSEDSGRAFLLPETPIFYRVAAIEGPGLGEIPGPCAAKEAGSSSPPLPKYTRVGVLLQGPLVC